LVIKDEVIDFIIEKGYSKEYGARHISRTLKKQILEKIAHCSLEEEWENARQMVCSLHKGEVVLQLETEEIAPLDESKLIEQMNIE
jgi:ATP-dependent Clp protease ATP-binding subunit ClpA